MTAPSTALRRLPVPESQPPYDDEVDAPSAWSGPRRSAGAAVQGTLALAFVLPSGLPATPAVPPDLRLLPPVDPAEESADQQSAGQQSTGRESTGGQAAGGATTDFGPQPTASAALPDPRTWSARLAQAVVEVLAGTRPVAQLVRWTTLDVYESVTAMVAPPRIGEGDPVARAVVRSVHVTRPVDGVAEVAATVRRGRRTAAMALRLEGLDGRWQCTALELG